MAIVWETQKTDELRVLVSRLIDEKRDENLSSRNQVLVTANLITIYE